MLQTQKNGIMETFAELEMLHCITLLGVWLELGGFDDFSASCISTLLDLQLYYIVAIVVLLLFEYTVSQTAIIKML